MIIRFAANLKWLFTELPFIERFEAAAREGFTGVEYASPYGHAPARLQRELRRWNLTQVLINTPAAEAGAVGENGYACIPGYADTFRAGVDQALNYARTLECRLINLMAGKPPSGCTMEAAEAVFRANLLWAAERASAHDVTLVLECLNQRDVPGYFLQGLQHARAFIQDIPQANVKMLFDSYHAGTSGLDVAREIARHRDAIAHIQIADVPGRHEPGSGDLPWDEIAQSIENSGYAKWIGCEYRPRTTTLEGLDWRRDFPPSLE